MHFQHNLLSKFTKDAKFFSKPTLGILSAEDYKKQKWVSQLPEQLRERVKFAQSRLKEPLKAGACLHVAGREQGEEDFWLAILPENKEMFFFLEFARDTFKAVLHFSTERLRVVFLSAAGSMEAADAFGAALAARVFQMPVFGKREKDQKTWSLKDVEIASGTRKHLEALSAGFESCEGTNMARFLATLPPNVLDPENYGDRIRFICKENGITVRFRSKDELKKMGAGSFTAVDRGNPQSAGGIYELSYSPKKGKIKKTIHLAGKGICFDTGGYDVKVGGIMRKMKGDMQGSAVALATMVTAVRMGLPYRMKAFLAVTENHISPKAYKPDEVVTALNGISIEVINTDAEGRMILADTLTLASREKPDCLIDFATLTGSAVRAIGTKYSAGFTNREALHEPIRKAGRKSGERVWTFPIDSTYSKALESKIADTLQCVPGSSDHILASCFLSKFVEEGTPWVHIDLSASENEGGLAHVDSLFTGFGVRWALEFMRSL